MIWSHRVIIIIPADAKALAEAAAKKINSTGPNYDGDAFTVQMSASGTAPATHLGLYTSATDGMVQAMAAALPQIPGVQFWRHGVNGDLQASNVSDAQGQPWGWAESLVAAGLKVVVQPTH